MSKSLHSQLVASALAGLVAGTLSACGGSEPAPAPEAPAATETKAAEAPAEDMIPAEPTMVPAHVEGEQGGEAADHGCRGKNECKGQGGCGVPGQNECKGQNPCKGKGGCNM